jgi:hypothetical protein
LIRSEHDKGLSDVAFNSLLLNSNDVESNSLGDWSALTNSDDVTGSNTRESWGAVSGEVMMSLLESVILLDVMEVISSEGNSTGHLSAKNDTFENSTSDANGGGEWALFIDVSSLDGGLWGFETYIECLD